MKVLTSIIAATAPGSPPAFSSGVRDVEKLYQEAHDPKRAAQSEDNLVFGAWLTALFVPIVGFVLGAILTTRQRELHGIGAMVLSAASACAWWAVIAAIHNSPY